MHANKLDFLLSKYFLAYVFNCELYNAKYEDANLFRTIYSFDNVEI